MRSFWRKVWRSTFFLVTIGGLALSGVGSVHSQVSAQTAPRVISTYPAAQEVVGPDSTLQIVFDQAMNRASVEAALIFEPKLGGTPTWTDDSTLTFKPAGPLQRGQEYRLTIGATAQSTAGTGLDDPFRLTFRVTPNLSVSQVVPAAGAENVEAGASLTVVFDRPVVPLVTSGEQSGLPQPLTFSPAVDGTGEWVGTAIYVFRPKKAFAGGTLYTATVGGDLKDVDGSPLDKPYTWQFCTVAPQILGTSPGNGAPMVPLESALSVQFNQPMDQASTTAAVTLRNAANGANVAGTIQFQDADRTLTFSPASRLELGTAYQFSILASARSASGQATLSNPQAVSFQTVPYPRVVRTYPANGEKVQPGSGVSIQFNAPMDEKSFAGKVTVDPAPDRLNIHGSGDYLSINFTALPDMTYTVTLAAGATDPYGNAIKETTMFSFSTENLRPALNIARRDVIAFTNAYRPDTVLLAAGVNISAIEMRLAALELPEFLVIPQNYSYLDLHAYNPPRITRQWTQPVEAAQNTRANIPLKLAGNQGGALTPGIYYVDAFAPEFRRFLQSNLQEPIKQIVVVANASLTVKQTAGGDMLVWVTDLKSGQPVASAQINVYSGTQLVGSGMSDSNGLVQLKVTAKLIDQSNPYWVVATGNGVFSLSSTQWTNDFQPYDSGAYYDFEPSKLNVYLYTDQPIYRPGRPVYFRGIVRNQDDVTFTVPAGEKAQVSVMDAQGKEIYTQAVTLNPYGGFNGKFDLAAQGDAPLGGYTLKATFRGRDSYLNFQVAEFRPPEFLVTATPSATEVAAGETLKVKFEAKFLFGGPVSGGQVNWVAVANQGYFNYLGEGSYDFSGPYNYVYNRQVAQGTGTLDAQGQLEIQVPADLGGVQSTQVFTIEANVTDISNQNIAGRTTVTVHPASLYVGLRPAQYVGQATKPMDVNVIAVDWASQPQAGQTVNVKASEIRWTQDPKTLDWSQQTTTVSEATLKTDEKGRAVFSFTPPRAGIYQIEATSRDPRERIALSQTMVWVQGREAVNWNHQDKHITLVADKKGQYQPGETASILIASPFPEPVKALVTVERAGIMKTELIEITGSYTYQLPLEAVHAPNVYVAVAIARGSGTGTRDNSITPEVRYGLIALEVKVQQQLKIKITPSTTSAEPGTTVKFDVLITDLNDKPVAAEIGLSMSDLATLSVSGANSQPIFAAFWGMRGLSVQTSGPLTKLIDDLLSKDIALQLEQERDVALSLGAPSNAPGAAAPPSPVTELAGKNDKGLTVTDGGSSNQAAVLTPRTNFVDTPLWVPNLVTDDSGHAATSVKLPDNLTTWRLDARAISAETYVGDATLDILSTKPLLVRPATPRFFVVGDESELAMVVNNNTPSNLTVDVSLDAKGVSLRADAKQTVKIPQNGRVRVTWLATVQDVDNVDLTFTAVSGQYGDSSKPDVGIGDARLLPVYKYLAPDYVATAGVLREPGTRTEGILLPSTALAPTGELTVKLSPSLAAATLDGLDYLRNFPYQCIEQTVSRFLPNIVTYRALQQVGLDKPTLRADLEAAVTYALNRLKSEQKPDGGWGWYPADESNLLTTAYALLGLTEARAADLPVDADMYSRALSFLLSHLTTASQATPTWELNRAAFVFFVLARANQPAVGPMDTLFTWREKLSYFARAYLAQAYALSQAADKQDKVNTLVSDLQSAAITSATGTHWEEKARDWWNWDSNTRSTAIILDTLIRLNPKSDLLPNVVRWLMIARKGDYWESTQETAWAVMALTNWMVTSGELKADYAFSVKLNGATLGGGKASADTLRDTTTLTAEVGKLLRGQLNRLSIEHADGPGSLYYTAVLHVNQPVESIKPTDRGLSLSRTYYLDGKPVTSAKVGDVLTVALEITLSSDLYYVVINDPIPAGTEAIDRSLKTTAQVGQTPELQRLDPRWEGWGWWWFSNTQIRTEKVVLSAQFLPRGTYRYVYQIQATTPGSYKVIPPNGNEFYFPEVFGRGTGSLFTVVP